MNMKKFILETSLLQAGDVICTREDSPSSLLVRKSLSCDYSHVLLYVADSSCIHADAQGVHSINTQRIMLDSKVDFKVLRHIPAQNLNAESIDKICNYARSKVGTEYSKIDAVKSGILRKTKKKMKIRSRYQFCSRLVAESFEFGACRFFDPATLCTPADILESKSFREIEGVVREATADEIEFANNVSRNTMAKQTAITNSILQDARAITRKDIQTFEDLFQAVIDSPELDEPMEALIKNSGYLTMWATDIINNPWRYFRNNYLSIDLFQLLHLEGVERELKMAKDDQKRYNSMRLSLLNVHESAPRKTFEQHIILYQVLQSLADQRVALFEWLREKVIDSNPRKAEAENVPPNECDGGIG